MKKFTKVFALLLTTTIILSACVSAPDTSELLDRIDALEKELDDISERLDALEGNPTDTNDAENETEQETESEQSTDSSADENENQDTKTLLNYKTLKDVLCKADVIDGMDDTFKNGTIHINPSEYFIEADYNCPLDDTARETINKNLQEDFGDGASFTWKDDSFIRDSYYIHIEENDEELLGIMVEPGVMEMSAKVYALQDEYLSEVSTFGLTEGIVSDIGLDEPAYQINFASNTNGSIAIIWKTDFDQMEQLYQYYCELFSKPADGINESRYSISTSDVLEDGTKIQFDAKHVDGECDVTVTVELNE